MTDNRAKGSLEEKQYDLEGGTLRYELWNARDWKPDNTKGLPKGYLITHRLSEDGAEEVVAWAPHRVKAERLAQLPKVEALASLGEDLAIHLLRIRESAPAEWPPEIDALLAEFLELKAAG